jgi:hypothetical protein
VLGTFTRYKKKIARRFKEELLTILGIGEFCKERSSYIFFLGDAFLFAPLSPFRQKNIITSFKSTNQLQVPKNGKLLVQLFRSQINKSQQFFLGDIPYFLDPAGQHQLIKKCLESVKG